MKSILVATFLATTLLSMNVTKAGELRSLAPELSQQQVVDEYLEALINTTGID